MSNHIMHIHARIEQCGVHRIFHGIGVDAQPHRGRTLRVEIDDKHATPILAQCTSDIDGTGGLADATFLVAHGDDPRRTVRLQRLRSGKRLIITSKQIRRHTVYLTNILVSIFTVIHASPLSPFKTAATPSSGARMRHQICLNQVFRTDMRVNLCGGNACMTKQLLHGTHIGTA